MCTAIHLSDEGLFGRTYDYEKSFGERVVFTPREFMSMGEAKNRYAMLGVGIVREGATLYFDGMNEWGLCGGALNFPGYAVYRSTDEKKVGIPSGLVTSFVLGFCKSVADVKALFLGSHITSESLFGLPSSPLHWIFADKSGSVTVESTESGLRVIDNPCGVMTNSPSLDYHIARLSDYASLHSGYPEEKLTKGIIPIYSRGMGAIGLPGDFSSNSRFVRGFFAKENCIQGSWEQSAINKMRHILSSVSIPRGCVITKEGEAVATLYSVVMDMEKLTYYFYSYENPLLFGVKLYPENTKTESFDLYRNSPFGLLN